MGDSVGSQPGCRACCILAASKTRTSTKNQLSNQPLGDFPAPSPAASRVRPIWGGETQVQTAAADSIPPSVSLKNLELLADSPKKHKLGRVKCNQTIGDVPGPPPGSGDELRAGRVKKGSRKEETRVCCCLDRSPEPLGKSVSQSPSLNTGIMTLSSAVLGILCPGLPCTTNRRTGGSRSRSALQGALRSGSIWCFEGLEFRLLRGRSFQFALSCFRGSPVCFLIRGVFPPVEGSTHSPSDNPLTAMFTKVRSVRAVAPAFRSVQHTALLALIQAASQSNPPTSDVPFRVNSREQAAIPFDGRVLAGALVDWDVSSLTGSHRL